MATEPFSAARIVESWFSNALPWTRAVREGQIASRRLVTDRAILQAVLVGCPRSVLDLGCGEGWLSRRLAAEGLDVIGVDVVPSLIAQARQAASGTYQVLSYEELAAGRLKITVDRLVCNFSLLGAASVDGLLEAAPRLLCDGGQMLIQTLHPLVASAGSTYQDGWREGSWDGFGPDFSDPAPWYFRTLGTWLRLFGRCGFHLHELLEPLHPATGQPASVIFRIATAPPQLSPSTGA